MSECPVAVIISQNLLVRSWKEALAFFGRCHSFTSSATARDVFPTLPTFASPNFARCCNLSVSARSVSRARHACCCNIAHTLQKETEILARGPLDLSQSEITGKTALCKSHYARNLNGKARVNVAPFPGESRSQLYLSYRRASASRYETVFAFAPLDFAVLSLIRFRQVAARRCLLQLARQDDVSQRECATRRISSSTNKLRAGRERHERMFAQSFVLLGLEAKSKLLPTRMAARRILFMGCIFAFTAACLGNNSHLDLLVLKQHELAMYSIA